MFLMKRLFFLFLSLFITLATQASKDYQLIEVTGLSDTTIYRFVENQQLYTERCDTLAQPKFWQTLMSLPEDSALINIGATRQIIKKIAIKEWNVMTNIQKDALRDSVRKHYNLDEEARVFMTSGKKQFYDFEKAIPTIGRGIEVFNENKVDPFYAQAILLIESPGKIGKSPVGAYGSFQLMRKVAINLGLKVNRYVDERKDFDKSAWAASKLIKTICIPELNKILDQRNITYNATDLWYRLLVLHVYHAGAGNVKLALDKINPSTGGMHIIRNLWQTEAGGFRNASQNYSQLALASLLELNSIIYKKCNNLYLCPPN